MPFYYSDRILAVRDGQLRDRDGTVELDGAAFLEETLPLPLGPLVDSEAVFDPAIELGAEHGPLHVDSGLRLDDLIVFLGRDAIGSSPAEQPAPFLVTEAGTDNEGSGILVAVDRVNRDPYIWLSDHTVQLANQLEPRTIRSLKGMFRPRLIRAILDHRIVI